MSIEFVPFDYENDDHYKELTAIYEASFPDMPVDEAQLRRGDKLRKEEERYYHRWLGRDPITNTTVSYGVYAETWWNANEDEYRMMAVTHPNHRNKGYASTFYNFALENLASDRGKITQLRSSTYEDQTQSVSFLENRGFELKDRYPRSELDLTQFNNDMLTKYQQRMADQGIKIQSLADLIPTDPDWQHKLHELDWILVQDEPTDEPAKKMPFEEYVKHTFENPSFRPETWMIATDKDNNYAGMSQLWIDKLVPDRLHTGWTGVDRPYRRKGVATALKLHAFEWAKGYGATHIRTDNHETNHMYQINLTLGFHPIPADLNFIKTVP